MKHLLLIKRGSDFLDKWLIPAHLKNSPLDRRKSRILVLIHLFLFFISLAIEVSNSVNFSEGENPPLKIAMLISVLLMLIFRFRGSFNLSGNLLSLFLFLVLLPSVYVTGGLYSDNLLWLMGVPLLALLFANASSGLYWLFFLLGFMVHLYVLDVQSPHSYREQTLQLSTLYFLISYSGLFIMVVGLVLIFATGQSIIIKALNDKQLELAHQKEKLAQQTRNLLEAEEKLLATNRELELFAYAASHDLKEPLRMIGSYTQLIKKRLSAQLEGATLEYMNFVTDGVSRMEKMLNDLLDYSRLGRRNEQVKALELNEVLWMVVKNMMAAMQDTDASVLSNSLPVIKASSTEMTQLFQNLISNSIKFSQNGVKPIIDIKYKRQDDTHHFLFQDNGIGIPEAHHASVFNIFERLHNHTEYEGNGIGLATCKKIIVNLGGSIWVEPSTGAGTTFCFSIPVTQLN